MYRRIYRVHHIYRDLIESIKLPQTGVPIDENSSLYAKEYLALGMWIREELPSHTDSAKFLFTHLALVSLYSAKYLPTSLRKLLNESEVHRDAPEVYQDVVITPYLLASLSINGINIHPSLVMAIPNWWNYMKDLHLIRLTDFTLSELPVIIENYALANGSNSLDQISMMRRKVEKYYPKLHKLFKLPLRCKKNGLISTVKLVYKFIMNSYNKNWLSKYIM